MKTKVKDWLKRYPQLVSLKRKIWSRLDGTTGTSTIDALATFPLYAPYTGGKYADKAAMTIGAINEAFPLLGRLALTAQGHLQPVEDISDFPKTAPERDAAARLKELLDHHGSDKANDHNYHHLYGAVLAPSDRIENIFEIGLGTNNTEIAANMGAAGRPGASLRAFRDFCPHARVYGADIDRRILFTEDRIETFYLDQTDPATFDDLRRALPAGFDLVIDDGLHAPHANIESLRFGLQAVKIGGWVVVEDISGAATALWQVVAGLLPRERYRSHVFKCDGAMLFAAQRLA